MSADENKTEAKVENKIGILLRQSRERLMKTQKDIADEVKVSEGTISRWESGHIDNMRRDKIASLSNALNLSPLDILGVKSSTTEIKGKVEVDNPRITKIHQLLSHLPIPVWDKIIEMISQLDITFSKNVSNLLQRSGDVNGFMQHTNLDFAAVGKFMQGEPTTISPDAAEKIAKFFKVDVVELYLDKSNIAKDNDEKTEHFSEPETSQDKPSRELDYTETGYHLRPFFDDIFESPHHPSIVFRCEELYSDESLDKFIRTFISNEEERCGSGDLDCSRIYKIIAELIVKDPDDFMKKYVKQENRSAALEILRSYVMDRF